MKKRLFSLLLVLALALSLCAAVCAEGHANADSAELSVYRRLDRVADLAGVIEPSRLVSLNALADEVSEKYQCDVAVVFVSSLEGNDIVRYSDNFFLDNGYGIGADRDGILLLISVGDREFNESTSGYAITAFTDYGLTNYLEPNFTRYLINGRDDWAGAAEQFINDCGTLLEQAQNGKPYDYYPSDPPEREPKSLKETAPLAALISAVVGFFSGGIPTGAMKRQMKSVEKNYGAAHYARGGLNLRTSDDRFLYANVAKTPIPQRTEHHGGGGGSNVHVTSGHTFGGSHGKF
ncbi:MAG: TPM domain-containing protein [Oscillospiraceae bacterium]|nr:TPM domain-containing protein [Oscillospiraceae bacterium]